MIKIIPSLIGMIIFCCSCKQPVKTASPSGYDLTRPEILKMPSGLNELSGIAFSNGNPDTLYAEQDEEGRLFYFPVASLDVKHQKFGKKGDYEDIAVCNGTVVMLRSDGVLFSFPLNTNGDEAISGVQETAGILPAGEYEAIYADEAASLLYVLCKNCNADNGTKSITGYILQMAPGKTIELKSDFRVNTTDIAAKLDEKKLSFRPSALAKNNSNSQWYIVSSVNKLLVITDNKWSIKEAYPLDPALFPQPEGIAFDKEGNLYISNERSQGANATILKFTLQKVKS
ncbi:MAG: SdiA-regulated domain-containing protein [Ferruginibacter sp.]|nr:SdiA-regulated domain-containing protein [Ferruginibacter sp.]